MKKNNMLRIASVLLVAVLLSTCAISGAFAKYTTSGTATADQARVANFGVTITGGTFDIASATYDADDEAEHGISVAVNAGADEVMAPGTTYILSDYFTFAEEDREVAVSVKYEAALTLTGWSYTPAGEDTPVEYCPLVFTVDGNEIKMAGEIDTVAELEAAVEKAINDAAAVPYAVDADTDIADEAEPVITWTWAIDVNDVADTAMGQATTKATVDLTISATVEQLD